MKEQIKKIIMDNEYFHSETAYSYCIDEEHAELLATRLDKAIGIDREKVLQQLEAQERAGFVIFSDVCTPEDLSLIITQSRPLKCEVGE